MSKIVAEIEAMQAESLNAHDTVTLPRYVAERLVELLASAHVSTALVWPRRDCVEVLKVAIAAQQPVKHVNYEPLHEFATDNRVSYNELCTAVHEALPQWQPISTIPKDGTKVLVWAGGVGMAYYKKGFSEAYGLFSNTLSTWDTKPTHWKPLPKGPV